MHLWYMFDNLIRLTWKSSLLSKAHFSIEHCCLTVTLIWITRRSTCQIVPVNKITYVDRDLADYRRLVLVIVHRVHRGFWPERHREALPPRWDGTGAFELPTGHDPLRRASRRRGLAARPPYIESVEVRAVTLQLRAQRVDQLLSRDNDLETRGIRGSTVESSRKRKWWKLKHILHLLFFSFFSIAFICENYKLQISNQE